MASSSGTCSGSSSPNRTSCSDESPGAPSLDDRKRKRMISNRESARRSRMRKQKMLDDLMAQTAHLSIENQRIENGISVAAQRYSMIEAENSVLRAQVGELRTRLEALDDIIEFLTPTDNGGYGSFGFGPFGFDAVVSHHQPVMASPSDLLYC